MNGTSVKRNKDKTGNKVFCESYKYYCDKCWSKWYPLIAFIFVLLTKEFQNATNNAAPSTAPVFVSLTNEYQKTTYWFIQVVNERQPAIDCMSYKKVCAPKPKTRKTFVTSLHQQEKNL